jgi:FkbM family methyltransferase
LAIGDKNKSSTINLYHELNEGSSSIISKYKYSNKIQKIIIKSLDNFYKKKKFNFKIDLIKIDVEGYELKVLDGMMNLINGRKINKILVEYHFNYISKNELKIIENKIITSGYKKKFIDKDCFVFELNKK